MAVQSIKTKPEAVILDQMHESLKNLTEMGGGGYITKIWMMSSKEKITKCQWTEKSSKHIYPPPSFKKDAIS